MHMQRRTKPARQVVASQIRRPPPALRLTDNPPGSRFAATLSAAHELPRPDIAAYQQGYRDSNDRNQALMRDLAEALEAAIEAGWPDEAEPRNQEWRRLIWRARRTPK